MTENGTSCIAFHSESKAFRGTALIGPSATFSRREKGCQHPRHFVWGLFAVHRRQKASVFTGWKRCNFNTLSPAPLRLTTAKSRDLP